MAYAAVCSLSKVLESSLVHDDQSLLPIHKQKITSFHGTVSSLLTFLEEKSYSKKLTPLESRIIDAAYLAEDIVETQLSSLYLSATSDKMPKLSSQSLPRAAETGYGDFNKVLEEFGLILKDARKIKIGIAEKKTLQSDFAILPTYNSLHNTEPTLVGLDDDFTIIRDRIVSSYRGLETIAIVGKGGIGKTALARKIFEDPSCAAHLDRRAWVIVPQEYSKRKMLLELLQSIRRSSSPDLHKKSDWDLTASIHQHLYGRSYLIVLDNVWSTEVLDDLESILPDSSSRSWLLLITRQLYIANYFGSSYAPHELRPLSDEQGWELLKQRVFGRYEYCPSTLHRIGKKIARRCEGLPLAIVAVAGLLAKQLDDKYWEFILRDISSGHLMSKLEISEILSLSYRNLPQYLRHCFLYLTAFPSDFSIDVNQLLWLWIAEGFVEPRGTRCMEEQAEEYLQRLIGGNLLIVTKKRRDGRIKTVEIDDASRYFGVLRSQEDRFHCQSILGKSKGGLRRLSTHESFSLKCLSESHDPVVRSLLVFVNYDFTSPALVQNCRLLRVLHAPMAPLIVEPENLFNLRYLAFEYHKPELPKLLSRLPNLRTLIVRESRLLKETCHGISVPLEILEMPPLRHLIVGETCRLEQPPEVGTVKESNLYTLSLVENLELATPLVEMFSNLRSLKLHYLDVSQQGWEKIQLNNLAHLQKLEELKMSFSRCQDLPQELTFPPNIKNLTLENCCWPWENMTIIGELGNLEVLKLRYLRFTASEYWEMTEYQFERLRYLEIRGETFCYWEVESYHLPSLETLVLKHVGLRMKEIPSGFGEIDTLQRIELHSCEPSIVASAKQIQAEQRELNNNDLKVVVIDK